MSADESGTISINDGTLISYRLIRPDDREALQRFHSRHSLEATYLRFFHAQPTLELAQARYFTELDGINRVALVALDPIALGEIIGVARFDRRSGKCTAEYAVIIAGDWQGKGLGLGLTRRLVDAAIRRGVRRFCAYVLPENSRMLNLLRDLKLPAEVTFEDGVERIEFKLIAFNDVEQASQRHKSQAPRLGTVAVANDISVDQTLNKKR